MEKCAGCSCPYGRDDQGREVLWPCQLPASYVSHGTGFVSQLKVVDELWGSWLGSLLFF